MSEKAARDTRFGSSPCPRLARIFSCFEVCVYTTRFCCRRNNRGNTRQVKAKSLFSAGTRPALSMPVGACRRPPLFRDNPKRQTHRQGRECMQAMLAAARSRPRLFTIPWEVGAIGVLPCLSVCFCAVANVGCFVNPCAYHLGQSCPAMARCQPQHQPIADCGSRG